MLADVRQRTIRPVIEATVAQGALVHTDEYGVYARLEDWGYGHETVCHARGVARVAGRADVALLGIRGVGIGAQVTSIPTSVVRRAFPRRRALWTTWKKAR